MADVTAIKCIICQESLDHNKLVDVDVVVVGIVGDYFGQVNDKTVAHYASTATMIAWKYFVSLNGCAHGGWV